jgi:GAF domain-containing protein
VSEIDAILEALRAETAASRVTLRRDLPGGYAFPVTNEALAPGVASLRDERTVDLRTQPVVPLLRRGEQVVQHDAGAAFDDPDFHRMLGVYGGLAAQIVTPVVAGGELRAIVSVHQLGAPRTWTDDEIGACTHAAGRISERL